MENIMDNDNIIKINESDLFSESGLQAKLAVFSYRGYGDPSPAFEKAIECYTGDVPYTELIDANMDNPWMRAVIIGINQLHQREYNYEHFNAKTPNDNINELGYHNVDIKKGVYGEISKIQEELDELKDAEEQQGKILIHNELSDLYGALEAYASKYGLTMDDLKQQSDLTKRAFLSGRRTSK